MNLAITLLVVIAIASVIGTVLQQNQPFNDYISKFGPFWFEVFKALSLYDVYGSAWFLVLLGFLLISTSVCVWRNAPRMVRDMRHYRLDVQLRSLRAFHLKREWERPLLPAEAVKRAALLLKLRGYGVRQKQEAAGAVLLAGMKGGANRLGYILSHSAIVVICIGGLLDGNLPLKLRALSGELVVEKRDLPASQVPPESTLPADASSFRGSVSLPEGAKADFIFLNVGDGYLKQMLPFTVALEDFRIEHYATGQPKSFESDLVLVDNTTGETVKKTIAVNHPLVYKGYSIYQASFSDGGSKLQLRAWSLDGPSSEAVPMEGAVGDELRLTTPTGPLTLELVNFKKFNIFPVEDDPTGKTHRNFGPSFVFKLRDQTGAALEYVNYQYPVPVKDRLYYLSGVRGSPAEEYHYLHIPLDERGGLDRFMALHASALDSERVRAAVRSQLEGVQEKPSEQVRNEVVDSIAALVQMFVVQGIDAVLARVDGSVTDPAKRNSMIDSYIKVLQGVLGELYIQVLRDEGLTPEAGVSEKDSVFFDDALTALSMLGPYGSPFYLQLASFEQRDASGLQITRAPGKDIVYLGCVMLMVGVFLMFYVHHRRIWVRVAALNGGSEVLFAGSGNRDRVDFEQEFTTLAEELDGLLQGHTSDKAE